MWAFALVALAGCASEPGGSAAELATGDWPVAGRLAEAALAGGEVLALATDGSLVRGPVENDGRFALRLAGGRGWVVHFAKDGAFGATLWVTASAGARSAVLHLPARVAAGRDVARVRSALEDDGAAGAGGVPGEDGAAGEDDGIGTDDPAGEDGSGELELGEVESEGGIATPEHDPGLQLDNDGDGAADANDEDADGSGVPDQLEEEEEVDVAAAGLVVTRIEPRPGAQEVDAGAKVEVKFALALDPVSVARDTVRLLDEGGADVPSILELDRDGREVTLEPAAALVPGATYTVVIEGVVGASGEALAAPFRSTFRVASVEEAAPHADDLRVRGLEPRHGEDDVALEAIVEVEFNLPLDAATVALGEAGFQLLGPGGAAVPGTLTLERAKRLVFVPAAPLAADADYVIALGSGFEAQGPQTMETAVRFGFRTRAAADAAADEDEEGDAAADAGEADGDGAEEAAGDPGGDDETAGADGEEPSDEGADESAGNDKDKGRKEHGRPSAGDDA